MNVFMFGCRTAAVSVMVMALCGAVQAVEGAEDVSFSRQVMPVLRANCTGCHKPGKSKGGLDLTTHASVARGGKHGPVFSPHDPAASPLIEETSGEEPSMPPEGEPLSPEEQALLKTWIAQGAVDDTASAAGAPPPVPPPPVYRLPPAVTALAWSPDGTLLAVPGRHEILLHGGPDLQEITRLPGAASRLEGLCFSVDGGLLAACGGSPSEFGEIQLWDTAARRLTRSIRTSGDSVFGVSLSSDNRRVAVGCADKLVRVFSTGDGQEIMKCDNHIDWVLGAAFARDGARLCTVGRDKAAKLIDVETGRLIDDINRPRDALLCVARHPSEDLVATGGTEGKIRLFKMEPRGGRLAEGDDKENSFVREFESLGSPLHSVAF
ncbi:MAG: hypothetical protein EOP86_10365, partial [Verrucomicrobiaceae bacterium]